MALALVTGAWNCASPAPQTPPNDAWFPAIVGRTWTFEGRQGNETSRGVFHLESGDSSSTFTLVVENPKTGKSERARLRVEGEDVTIFWTSGRFDLLRAPLVPGRKWTWDERGRRTDATVVGIEPLQVGGSPTPCLHIRYELLGAPTQDYWFARGLGWVRIQLTSSGSPPDVRELILP
ncbi:MAG: hypothetical protein HYR85_05625 [Planctomycetes bacterium]|nr:hypothetical protein [Planctomycetota bacterium]MBI3848280.1 hypothetical protein [Planctomycetota bacterium]